MFLAPKQSEMTALSPAAGLPGESCDWGRAGSQPDQEVCSLPTSSGTWVEGRVGASTEPQPWGQAHGLRTHPCMSTTAGTGRPALGTAPVAPPGRPHGKPGSQPGRAGPSTPRAGFHSSCLAETMQRGKPRSFLKLFGSAVRLAATEPGGRPARASRPGSVHMGVHGALQSCWG